MTKSFGLWLDNAVWVILFVLLVPSGFAVASWNSLPGNGLYGIRITMENMLLTVAPSHEIKGQLYVTFTQRDVRDATRVLSDNGSTVGLTYLDAHVIAAKENIQKAPDSNVRAQLAQRYITTLKEANVTLEKQKQISFVTPASAPEGAKPPNIRTTTVAQIPAVAVTSVSTPVQNRIPSSIPMQIKSPSPTTSSTVTNPSTHSAAVADQVQAIANTQITIQETIDELEQVVKNTPDHKRENDKDKDKDRDNSSDNKDKGRSDDEDQNRGNNRDNRN